MGIKTPEWPVPGPTRWSCGQVRPPVPTPGGDAAIPTPAPGIHSHAVQPPFPRRRPGPGFRCRPGSPFSRPPAPIPASPGPRVFKKSPYIYGGPNQVFGFSWLKKHHFFVKTVNSDYMDYGRPIPVVL